MGKLFLNKNENVTVSHKSTKNEKQKVVISMKNNEIIIIYKEVGKSPTLRKIKNDLKDFENLLERKNTSNSL